MSSEMRNKLVFIAIVVVILGGLALWNSKGNMSAWGKTDNSWYAVYLNNNQVYFGHITGMNDNVITLKDVQYAEQVNVPAQTSTSKNFAVEQTPKQSFRLVQRGNDTMLTSDHTLYLNRSSVAYWEKFTADAGVVKLLEEAK